MTGAALDPRRMADNLSLWGLSDYLNTESRDKIYAKHLKTHAIIPGSDSKTV